MFAAPHDDAAAAPLAALRQGDRDRYLQVLLARSADRPALLALFLLNLELARIPDAVREPMAGLIRLQWWREALEAAGPPRHPVLAFMAETDLRRRLDDATLTALIDARERELDATPLHRAADLEAYAAATAGALNRAAATVIGASARVAEQAAAVGTAYGVLGILRALPFALRRGGGAFALSAAGPEPVPASLEPVVREAAGRAQAQLQAAAPLRGRAAAPVLVQGLLARQDLDRLERAAFDLSDGRLVERPPWTVARCLLASALGRY